jgi:hypothetical protein
VFAALLTAIGTVVVTVITARKRNELERELAETKTELERQLAEMKAGLERELAEETRYLDWAKQEAGFAQADKTTRASQEHDLSLETIRIDHERRRLRQQTNASELEIELAATRLAREQQLEQAKLVHLFSDRFLSEREPDRAFALFAISSFVDTNIIKRLAKGGEGIVSRSSLSRLAASGSDAAAVAAQEVLNEEALFDRTSVVLVSSKNDGSMRATGFFCRESIIVTSAIAAVGSPIYYRHRLSDPPQSAKCIATDPENLIVVASVDGKAKARPLRTRSDEYQLDRERRKNVTIWQWRLDDRKFIVRSGIVEAVGITISFASSTEERQAGKGLIEISILSEQGCAGAPVFDDRGRVLGVIIAEKHSRELSYAVSMNVVEKIILSSSMTAASDAV